MRQSPAKITFNYATHKEETPLYSPQLIHSGYIVGEPVAYTDQPSLPPNYQLFSPKRQRAITSLPLNRSVHYHRDSFQSKYEAPDPAFFAPPLRQSFKGSASHRGETVSFEEYNSLKQKYAELQLRYRNLQQRWERAIKETSAEKVSHLDQKMEGRLEKLIEVYKQNTIKEAQLLLDRYQLQSKQARIDSLRKQ